MSLLPEGATFEELVQECFLAFRGSGLMLSPLDAALVSSWARLNVPYEVVARGIRRAAERAAWDTAPGEPLVRSLRACRRAVEREIASYLARVPGARTENGADFGGTEPQPFDVTRHQKLRAALRALEKERPELGGVIQTLKAGILAHPPETFDEVTQRGDRVACLLLRGLPFAERRELLREARSRGSSTRMSLRARKIAQRFHRAAVVSHALGLPALG